MNQLLSTVVALSALTYTASARPQGDAWCVDYLEYADGVQLEGPYLKAPESAGGMSCISSSDATGNQGCEHSKSYSHGVGVSYSVGGGISGAFDIGKVFSLGGELSASKE